MKNRTTDKLIPYGRQSISKEDIDAVVGVLKSPYITQGPNIKAFEEALCKYTGAKYAVVVSSGTAALHIACLTAGIKQGDEVITSPITFVASANCILYCGGEPVFADIQEDTANIGPEEIRKKIIEKTKAIVPVHYAGHPCDLKEIQKIAKRHKLIVIEDAAHALGAEYKGSKIGSCKYSDMAIFSFHPLKSITTGEGGAVLSNQRVLYKKLLMFRNHGITKESNEWIDIDRCRRYPIYPGWYYEMQTLGFNYRITDIQAALGLSQLRRLDDFIVKRRKIAKLYEKAFKNNTYFDIPIEKNNICSAWHLYSIRLKDNYKPKKMEIFSKLRKEGLGVQVHYIPVYLQPHYKKLGFKTRLCPKAEGFYEKEISIPLHQSMSNKDAEYVINTVLTEFKNLRWNK